jgi:conjugative coupling factor TraD (TOL family)
MSYPIENQFRKPVEFVSAVVCIACAVGALIYHFALGGVSIWVTLFTALLLLANAMRRTKQGLEIFKFQMNLRWLPTYELKSDDIPWSKKELFLGMGFYWDQSHTQRLFLARQPQNKHLRARNSHYETARAFERNHPDHWRSRLTSKQVWWNPVSPLPNVGGDPAIHGVEPHEREVWMSILERVGHTVVLGTTRVGKTRFAEILITQDIHRGDVVIVVDPKGDVELLKRMYAEAARAGRSKDFWFFHLGYPEISDRYSPVSSIGRITEVATRLANQLPGEGQSAAFKEFVWLYVNILSRTMFALGMNPTYELLAQYAADIDTLAEKYFEAWLNKAYPDWLNYFEGSDQEVDAQVKKTGRSRVAVQFLVMMRKKGWSDPIADGLSSILANDKARYQALINSLYPLLQKLTSGKVSELLSPKWEDVTDKRRIFDWDKIMNMGGIVYIGLDALSDPEVAAAVGNAMFADLTSTAGRRYKFGTAYGQGTSESVASSRKVSIHADEFNELIGDEFVPLLNKAGGAGYQVAVYTQTWSDVEARLGSAAKAAQIGGNLNTMIMLRVKNTETAELLTDQLPKVNVYSSTLVSGSTGVQNPEDFADFGARTEDRLSSTEVPMLQPTDLVQLPKGQAFALIEGGQLVKLRLPLPSDESDQHWPASMEAVFTGMQAKYQRYVHQADAQEMPSNFDGGTASKLTTEGAGSGF